MTTVCKYQSQMSRPMLHRFHACNHRPYAKTRITMRLEFAGLAPSRSNNFRITLNAA